MTILPNCNKKKSPQVNGGSEIENAEGSSSTTHHTPIPHQLPNMGNLASHIQTNGEGTSRGNLYLASQSPPPCWPPNSTTTTPREEKRTNLASPSPYDEPLENAPSHSKRRYRASPLRSVRPKLREHRGNTSPSYPSTSGGWNVSSIPHQHSLNLQMPSSPLPSLPASRSPQAGPSHTHNDSDEDPTAYNSGDEYETFDGWNLTKEEWDEKERWFEKKMKKKGLTIKKMREDGACLFRAIADQVYGDQDMNSDVRKNCMNYIQRNESEFAPFVSEPFAMYVERKRRDDCFGNHIEIAAMSEMYNRIIEVYCYSTEPINIFQGSLRTDNAPIRLSYHRGTHYNSLVDPYTASIGVGLGLPGMQPGLADKNLMSEAARQSENFHLEQTMLEDKIRATDFEATSQAIEEQVAQQSYLEWVRTNCSNSQKTDGESAHRSSPRLSPRSEPHRSSPRGSISPKASVSTIAYDEPDRRTLSQGGPSDLAIPGSSKDPTPSSSRHATCNGFTLDETASFLNQVPSDILGLSDYSNDEAEILAKVLAMSQQEYLDSLKSNKEGKESPPHNSGSSSPS